MSFPTHKYTPTIYYSKKPKLPLVLSLLLSPFLKMVYKLPSLTAFLALHFFVEPCAHKTEMFFLLLICLLEVQFANLCHLTLAGVEGHPMWMALLQRRT